jgi:hypothetical protein
LQQLRKEIIDQGKDNLIDGLGEAVRLLRETIANNSLPNRDRVNAAQYLIDRVLSRRSVEDYDAEITAQPAVQRTLDAPAMLDSANENGLFALHPEGKALYEQYVEARGMIVLNGGPVEGVDLRAIEFKLLRITAQILRDRNTVIVDNATPHTE